MYVCHVKKKMSAYVADWSTKEKRNMFSACLTRQTISKALAAAGIPENPVQTAFILGLHAGLIQAERQFCTVTKSDQNLVSGME